MAAGAAGGGEGRTRGPNCLRLRKTDATSVSHDRSIATDMIGVSSHYATQTRGRLVARSSAAGGSGPPKNPFSICRLHSALRRRQRMGFSLRKRKPKKEPAAEQGETGRRQGAAEAGAAAGGDDAGEEQPSRRKRRGRRKGGKSKGEDDADDGAKLRGGRREGRGSCVAATPAAGSAAGSPDSAAYVPSGAKGKESLRAGGRTNSMRASLDMDERVRSGVASSGALRALSAASLPRSGASTRNMSVKGPAEAEGLDSAGEDAGDGSDSDPSITAEHADSALKQVFVLPGDEEARVKKQGEVGVAPSGPSLVVPPPVITLALAPAHRPRSRGPSSTTL